MMCLDGKAFIPFVYLFITVLTGMDQRVAWSFFLSVHDFSLSGLFVYTPFSFRTNCRKKRGGEIYVLYPISTKCWFIVGFTP